LTIAEIATAKGVSWKTAQRRMAEYPAKVKHVVLTLPNGRPQNREVRDYLKGDVAKAFAVAKKPKAKPEAKKAAKPVAKKDKPKAPPKVAPKA
jgi:hypothetical protein